MESVIVEYITSPVLLAAISVTTTVIFLYRLLVSPHRLLSRHGIKGPRPLPLVGNYLSIRQEGHDEYLKKQLEKYGSVFGYYLGSAPRVLITDLDLAKEIMVKEFDKFTDRGMLGMGDVVLDAKEMETAIGMFLAREERWRKGRLALSPSFSGMKMKLMEPLLKRSSDVLVEKMGEFAESGKSVEMFRMQCQTRREAEMLNMRKACLEQGTARAQAQRRTVCMGNSQWRHFGRYINIQRGEGDELTEAAKIIFDSVKPGSMVVPELIITIISTFPCLLGLLRYYYKHSEVFKHGKRIQEVGTGLIKARIDSNQPPKVKDLLQLMIDASAEEKDPTKRINSQDMVAFSSDFLLAGYETTANNLSYITFILATHPDVQEKLQSDIDEYFEENPDSSLYEAAQKLKYMEKVIHETMRLYTTVPRTQRRCAKTVTLRGVTIPKGADVIFPMDIIHHMPQYWPDPDKFDPERFTPEEKAKRSQLAHMPFGWGPRSCIGLRFSLLETKLALIEILRKYSFARAPETPAKLEQVVGVTASAKGGVYVKVISRR